MPDSLIIDWLYENSYRAYPLKETITRTSGGYTLTNDVIVDAQFVYTSIPSPVQLESIAIDSINATFTISGALVFVVPLSSIFPYALRLSSGNLLVVGSGVLNIPVGTYTFSNVSFESCIATEFSHEWLGVQSLQFNSTTLTGNINFLNGYQFEVGISPTQITFNAGSLYGTPISCTSFGDIPQDCSSVLSFINGGAPLNNILKIVADSGIIVLDDPTNHRIFIGLSFNPSTDVCPPVLTNPNEPSM